MPLAPIPRSGRKPIRAPPGNRRKTRHEVEDMDRPSGRHRHVTGEGKGVSRRGSGIGAGPTGSGRRGNSGNDGFAGGTSGKSRGRLTGMGPGGMEPGGPFFGGMVPGGRRRGGCSRYLFLVILFVIVIFIVDSCSNGLLSDDSSTGFGNDAYVPASEMTRTPTIMGPETPEPLRQISMLPTTPEAPISRSFWGLTRMSP